MTRKVQQQKSMLADAPQAQPAQAVQQGGLPAPVRQSQYRSRERARNERNAQLANEGMGIVNVIKRCGESGTVWRGVDSMADECTILRQVATLLMWMAKPGPAEEPAPGEISATVPPSKGSAKPRKSRARVGK